MRVANRVLVATPVVILAGVFAATLPRSLPKGTAGVGVAMALTSVST